MGQLRSRCMEACNETYRSKKFPKVVELWLGEHISEKGYPSTWSQIFRDLTKETAIQGVMKEKQPFDVDEIHRALQDHKPPMKESTYDKKLGEIADLSKGITVPDTQHLAAGPNGSSAACPGADSRPTPLFAGTSTFEGCVTLNQDPGYVVEDGESRKIEEWIALCGNRHQLLIRTN
ncbi:hypothetical protein LTR49_028704, partial [Elasticomyces elasticus]